MSGERRPASENEEPVIASSGRSLPAQPQLDNVPLRHEQAPASSPKPDGHDSVSTAAILALSETMMHMTAKETARAVLDRLPEDCGLDEVLYHLYVAQAAQQGLSDADAGRTIPHERVESEMRRKWLLGNVG
jgi:predicted transcriptional regulator